MEFLRALIRIQLLTHYSLLHFLQRLQSFLVRCKAEGSPLLPGFGKAFGVVIHLRSLLYFPVRRELGRNHIFYAEHPLLFFVALGTYFVVV